jgi:hypothetical protein
MQLLLIIHYICCALLSAQVRQCKYKRNIQLPSRNCCFCGKAKCIPYFERERERERVCVCVCVYVCVTVGGCVCVCVSVRKDFVIQHAKHMHHVILSSLACLALPYFYTYKRQYFWKNCRTNICVLIFTTAYI